MSRVKRGMMHVKRRKNILAQVRGYRHGRKNLIKLAQMAILKAGVNSYVDRKLKKRNNRMAFNVRLNAGLRALGTKYSVFISQMKKKNIGLDRKVLSQLADENPEVFAKVVEAAK
jgi:large subunit ribosomal protein L20